MYYQHAHNILSTVQMFLLYTNKQEDQEGPGLLTEDHATKDLLKLKILQEPIFTLGAYFEESW